MLPCILCCWNAARFYCKPRERALVPQSLHLSPTHCCEEAPQKNAFNLTIKEWTVCGGGAVLCRPFLASVAFPHSSNYLHIGILKALNSLLDMSCWKCGTPQTTTNVKFCIKCGAKPPGSSSPVKQTPPNNNSPTASPIKPTSTPVQPPSGTSASPQRPSTTSSSSSSTQGSPAKAPLVPSSTLQAQSPGPRTTPTSSPAKPIAPTQSPVKPPPTSSSSSTSSQAVNNNNKPTPISEDLCSACGKGLELGSGATVTDATGRQFHQECVFCVICKKKLDKEYMVKENKFYCREDYPGGPGGQCRVCYNAITTGEAVQDHKGNRYHVACFACKKCREPIDSRYSMDDQGGITCAKCAGLPSSSSSSSGSPSTGGGRGGGGAFSIEDRCHACEQALSGAVVGVGDAKYHQSCFVCPSCRVDLTKTPFLMEAG